MKLDTRTAMALTRVVLVTCVVAIPAISATSQAESQTRPHVEYLASDDLEGRLVGSEGAHKAADYIVGELEAIGVVPMPGRDGFRLPFGYTAGVSDSGSTIAFTSVSDRATIAFVGLETVSALSFSDAGTANGSAVFAGYGIVLPDGAGVDYDSYSDLNVDGKIVVVLRYLPEDVDQDTRATLARFSGLRYKAMAARERGAAAIIVVTGPRSQDAGATVPMSYDAAASGSGIVAASIGGEVTDTLFAGVEGMTLESIQEELDNGNAQARGFEIPGVEVSLTTRIEREQKTGYNVVGYLPANATDEADPVDHAWVMLGAHFDHLGRGASGNSLARDSERGEVHNGADDNASGVAATLVAARHLASMQRERNVAFAFWSGEEMGILGATAYVQDPAVALEEMAAYLNFDMVGRSRDNKVTLQAVGSSDVWPRLIEQSNIPVGFAVQTTNDPYLPTDSSAFNQARVPNLSFFTGTHDDYHRPSDDAETLDYEALDRVARLGSLIGYRVANLDEAPEFEQVERTMAAGGDRDTARAWTGTIPDFGSDAQGLLLGGVMEGGPAAEAGLQEGDLVIEFAGQTITNIYDYTYALEAVKVGVPVKVVFMRGEERIETTLTPRARQ